MQKFWGSAFAEVIDPTRISKRSGRQECLPYTSGENAPSYERSGTRFQRAFDPWEEHFLAVIRRAFPPRPVEYVSGVSESVTGAPRELNAVG